MNSFQTGQTYATRSICDHNCIVRVTIARRTAKTIVTTEGKTLRISPSYQGESVKPWGSASMCPMITAADLVMS
jgi:hypothetical protein